MHGRCRHVHTITIKYALHRASKCIFNPQPLGSSVLEQVIPLLYFMTLAVPISSPPAIHYGLQSWLLLLRRCRLYTPRAMLSRQLTFVPLLALSSIRPSANHIPAVTCSGAGYACATVSNIIDCYATDLPSPVAPRDCYDAMVTPGCADDTCITWYDPCSAGCQSSADEVLATT